MQGGPADSRGIRPWCSVQGVMAAVLAYSLLKSKVKKAEDIGDTVVAGVMVMGQTGGTLQGRQALENGSAGIEQWRDTDSVGG